MAQQSIVCTITMRLPWWWRAYVYALKLSHDLGVIDVDPSVAAAFIIRHTRFIPSPRSSTKVDIKTRRYFERAPIGHHVSPHDLDLDQE